MTVVHVHMYECSTCTWYIHVYTHIRHIKIYIYINIFDCGT